jgi:hypothetical protein
VLARLGNVLYWTAAALSVLIVVVGIPAALNEAPPKARWSVIAVFFAIAGAVWLAGRACRYVLAGR